MTQKLKIDNTFGKRLRALRLEHGYTQEQIAVKLQLRNLDISRSAYAQIECGTYNIKIEELQALHDIYGISYDDFFEA